LDDGSDFLRNPLRESPFGVPIQKRLCVFNQRQNQYEKATENTNDEESFKNTNQKDNDHIHEHRR